MLRGLVVTVYVIAMIIAWGFWLSFVGNVVDALFPRDRLYAWIGYFFFGMLVPIFSMEYMGRRR